MAKRNCVKIALVSPPPPLGAHVDYQNPLIGLAAMAAVLEKNGDQVAVVDCPRLDMTHEDLKREIARLEPDMVGITCVTTTFSSALQAARVIKEAYSRALIALGGPHATFMDSQILSENPEVDIVVRGEGEQTVLELASHVSDSCLKELHEVAGITFRKNGQIVQTQNRPFIQNLDQLPFPAFKYFPLRKYRLFGKLNLPIITSRGCSFQCAFCLVPQIAGNKFRARNPKNVVDELEWLRDAYGAAVFTFQDETFTYDKKRALEICEEIKKRNIGVPWDCQTRVDQISKKLLVKMKNANCQLVSYGVESGNQKILDAMKKGTTVEQNERAIRWTKEAGLSVAMSAIIGYPGETIDTLEQTLDFIRRTEPDDVYLCLATPYPGTQLRSLLEDLGWKMSTEWSHYEIRTPVFENPLLPSGRIKETREAFYNHFYSIPYVLRQSLKGTFYSQNMARTAAHHLSWQIKVPSWISDNLKKLTRL
ncbi:MAG: radical SAM protein [Candidatus Bathyarchaeota archaeon]|nr:radical SAM protein [Candidatus Bathyarchaeota archaeon]